MKPLQCAPQTPPGYFREYAPLEGAQSVNPRLHQSLLARSNVPAARFASGTFPYHYCSPLFPAEIYHRFPPAFAIPSHAIHEEENPAPVVLDKQLQETEKLVAQKPSFHCQEWTLC
jgi:hypothetical protein